MTARTTTFSLALIAAGLGASVALSGPAAAAPTAPAAPVQSSPPSAGLTLPATPTAAPVNGAPTATEPAAPPGISVNAGGGPALIGSSSSTESDVLIGAGAGLVAVGGLIGLGLAGGRVRSRSDQAR